MHSERGNNSTRLECCWRCCDLIVIAVSASFARLFPTFFKERNEGQIEAEVLLDGAARPLQVKYVESHRRTGASFILEHGCSNPQRPLPAIHCVSKAVVTSVITYAPITIPLPTHFFPDRNQSRAVVCLHGRQFTSGTVLVLRNVRFRTAAASPLRPSVDSKSLLIYSPLKA